MPGHVIIVSNDCLEGRHADCNGVCWGLGPPCQCGCHVMVEPLTEAEVERWVSNSTALRRLREVARDHARLVERAKAADDLILAEMRRAEAAEAQLAAAQAQNAALREAITIAPPGYIGSILGTLEEMSGESSELHPAWSEWARAALPKLREALAAEGGEHG